MLAVEAEAVGVETRETPFVFHSLALFLRRAVHVQPGAIAPSLTNDKAGIPNSFDPRPRQFGDPHRVDQNRSLFAPCYCNASPFRLRKDQSPLPPNLREAVQARLLWRRYRICP